MGVENNQGYEEEIKKKEEKSEVVHSPQFLAIFEGISHEGEEEKKREIEEFRNLFRRQTTETSVSLQVKLQDEAEVKEPPTKNLLEEIEREVKEKNRREKSRQIEKKKGKEEKKVEEKPKDNRAKIKGKEKKEMKY